MGARKHFSRLGFAYVAFFAVMVLVQLFLGAALYGVGSRLSTDATMLLTQVATYGCGFPVFYLMMKKIPAWRPAETRKLPAGRFFLWLVFCFGLTYVGNIIGQILMLFAGLLAGRPFASPVQSLVAEMSPWALFVLVVIIAPVMEELMFRKFLVDRTVQYGQKTAVIVSGVCFGLFHGNFYQFFYACTLGMTFAYLYSSTGKIRYNILIHMIINFVGGVAPALMLGAAGENPLVSMAASALIVALMAGSILCSIVLVCLYAGKLPVFPGWEDRPQGGLWRAVFTAPGTVVFLVMSVALFAVGAAV